MNKKLLRTSVIASVMAMAFTASAWAYNYDYDGYGAAEVNSTGKNTNTGVMWDAGWYAPDGKFYTYVQTDGSINTANVLSYNREPNSGPAIGLTTAQLNKLKALGLDHNSQADSVWDHDAVPHYTTVLSGSNFNAENVSKLLADNLKFNADLNYTLIEWEEAARKEHDKDLDTRIRKIQLVDNGNNSFTFTNGAGEKETISFADTDTNTRLVNSSTGLGFTSDGKLSLVVVDEAGRKVTGLADIGEYVNKNAGNAIYSGNTTINQQITENKNNIAENTQVINQHTQQISENKTNITNNTNAINYINDNNVSKVTVNGDELTFHQTIGGKDETFTYTDKHITGHSMSIDGDSITSTITTNMKDKDGNAVKYENIVRVGDATINYAGDIVVNNQDGTTTQVDETIENAINNNYNKIVHIEDNSVTYIQDAGVNQGGTHIWKVTQTQGGISDPVTITDTKNKSLQMEWLYDLDENGNRFRGDYIQTTVTDTEGNKVSGWIGDIAKASLLGKMTDITDNADMHSNVRARAGIKNAHGENGITVASLVGEAYSEAYRKTRLVTDDNNLIVEEVRQLSRSNEDTGVVYNVRTNNEVAYDKVTINNGGPVIHQDGINMNQNNITNLADGEISANSTEAINGSQLWETNRNMDKLGGRLDKVGAGAAALAALHPMDFDPDDKLQFSAGVGNYKGETAAAIGAFYRPTEKVMFSVAGTMGNGENMVNAGVTFALDRKNNVSNSRVAMAHEIKDLRDQVAALTALVSQIAGKGNPLLDTVMFPDVPENHWAYDYIDSLQKRGIIEGYPDGNFGGDRSCTRYEYAAMLYRALEKGFPVDGRLLKEFEAELGRIRIDRIKGADDDANKVERVRVNDYEDRDDYGSKLAQVVADAAPAIEEEPAA